jgi:Fe-S-cluster-containing hydrogenase component 2/bacterioferritin-associated ferredoxin
MLEKTGVAGANQINEITPPKEIMKKGPVAVIECFQKIPCNPCAKACKVGAIKPFNDINDRPEMDYDKCTGCGLCMIKCPGLAIFIVDETYSETEALVKIPYEFIPLPAEGSFVTGLDRKGSPVCRAKVVKVQTAKHQDRTSIVAIAVPKEFSMEVRCLSIEDYFGDNTIICRCEEITLGEIREYIRQGYQSVDEIKRMCRTGMGPCQGKTCRPLIMQEISKATGVVIDDLNISTFRPPTKPIKLGFFTGGDSNE